jgi:hypothetical protein
MSSKRFERFPWILLMGIMFLPGEMPVSAQTYLNAQMPWHSAVLDAQGRVLAWYHPEKNLGYDEFLRLDWDFLEHKVPIDTTTGVKVYLTAPIFDGKTLQGVSWQVNPASTFAHLMDLLLGWYPYSGDDESIGVLREMLDYQLAHGLTPADWDWASVPFATGCLHEKEYGRCIQDMPQGFYGGIEADKVGELGLSFVEFYELTGERKYLDEGIKCANQLAKHVRPGDAFHTPWPYRLDAHAGTVIAGEEYGGMIVAPVRLFDELVRIGEGDTASYKKTRDAAWKWILDNPLNKESAAWEKWVGYYEDVPKDTVNQNDMLSMMTAYYILSREDPAELDPNWKEDVGYLLDRSRELLGRGPFYGAWAIDEQLRPDGGIGGAATPEVTFPEPGGQLLRSYGRGCCSRAGLVCRTSQWGAINAMYFEKTHDGRAREDAFRSLNYATYFLESDGKINCCGDSAENGYWFEDGYGDAGRSFTWAMGAVPEFAPIGQDHLLRSSSIVRKVKYGNQSIQYQTFDKSATEVLRLSFKPEHIAAGNTSLTERSDLNQDGYTIRQLSDGDYELRVRHSGSNEIRIT